MIEYSLTISEITVGKRTRVTFSLLNAGPGACTSIAIYLGFPTEINLIEGWREIKISRLGDGESKQYQLEIIGKPAGPSFIEILSMSYFGSDGSKVKLIGEKIPIEILEQEQPVTRHEAISLSKKVFQYEQWDVLEGIIDWQGDTLPDNVRLQTHWPLECREPYNIERIEYASVYPFRLYVRPMELGEHVPVKITFNGASGITLYEQYIYLHVVTEVKVANESPLTNTQMITIENSNVFFTQENHDPQEVRIDQNDTKNKEKRTYQKQPQSGNHRAVILTALSVEYLAIRSHLANIQEIIHPKGTVYESGIFYAENQVSKVGIVEIGPGNLGAAQETERAIAFFQPDVVLFVGVAGGIKDVSLGDVVVATKVYGYEAGKAADTFLPRPNVANIPYVMEQRARAEARKEDWLSRIHGEIPKSKPNVFIGPIAAGEKVVASTRSPVYEFLRFNYGDALAVEMEGRGFLQATHSNLDINALIIRGISDLIEGKNQADLLGSQEIASHHAAAFAFEILAKLATGDRSNKPQSL